MSVILIGFAPLMVSFSSSFCAFSNARRLSRDMRGS